MYAAVRMWMCYVCDRKSGPSCNTETIAKDFNKTLMTHKYKGSIVVLSISKNVKPNEEQKEMISSFQ